MEKPTLTLMVGLPYSGKTTQALKLGIPIVSPDAVRLALHGQRFLQEAEFLVWPMCLLMVKALFAAGHTHIVIDATYNTVKRRQFWADAGDWAVQYRIVDTPEKLCIQRAQQADDLDIVPIICRMASGHEPVTADEEMAGRALSL